MSEYSVVMTTCASADKARPIINALLETRLAACVQMMPINSFYIWEGAVQNEDEALLFIKCKTTDYKAIEKTILLLHEYKVPEIIQVPVTDGHDRYLAWLADPK